MNKQNFVKRVSEILRENNIKKPVHIPKQVFHISDDEGNSKDFTVKKTDKSVLYTKQDIADVVDACLYAIQEALKQGEEVSFHGFGTFGLKYRQPRSTKKIGTNEEILISGRYVPKFSFGNDLRTCAKIYELSQDDKSSNGETTPDESYKGGNE